MRNLPLALGICCIFAQSCFGTQKEDGTRNDVESARSVLLRLNELCLQKGYPRIQPDAENIPLVAGEVKGFYRETNCFEVCARSHVYVKFFSNSSSLFSITKDYFNLDAQLFSTRRVPTWSPERAVKEARDWIGAFLGTFPEMVGEPRIEYLQQSEYPKFYDGIWEVRWPRSDSKGHLFYHDALYVELSESRGLRAARRNYFSMYQESETIPISESAAVMASRIPAKTFLSKVAPQYLGTGLELGANSDVLRVVNPNGLLEGKDDFPNSMIGDFHARLAWVILYPLNKFGAPPHHALEVFIDAQTGKPIGAALRA